MELVENKASQKAAEIPHPVVSACALETQAGSFHNYPHNIAVYYSWQPGSKKLDRAFPWVD